MKRSRRRFLRRLAATVGGGSLAASAGCRRTPDAPSEGPTPTDGDQTDASPTDDGSPTPTVSDGTTASTVATDIDPLDGSWRSYRRDAANTAATDDPGPTEQPALAWRRSATMDASPETDPVAVDGAFAFVSTGGRPYALDGDTGRIRWQADRTASTDVDPVAIDGNVVVADGETVSNVAGDTGEERWTAPLDGAVVGLAAGNGSVVAATDSGVTALEPGDGSERWHHSVDGTIETPPAVGEETVAVRVSTAVLALDAASGEQRWRGSAGDAGFPPAVGHGHVYVASERRLRVLNEADGAEKWTVSPDLPIAGPPVVSADSVFLPTMNDDAEREGSETGEGTRTATPLPTDARRFEADVLSLAPDGSEQWRSGASGRWNFTSGTPDLWLTATADRVVLRITEGLLAFDAANGEGAWTAEVGARGGAPVVADGVVSTGAVGVAIDDGTELWRFEVGDRVESSPAVVGNTLYVGSDDTHLYAVAANSGGVEWRGQTGGQIKSSPAVGDDAVYVGSQDGFLYAFERGSGSERWRFDTGGAVESSPTLHDGTV